MMPACTCRLLWRGGCAAARTSLCATLLIAFTSVALRSQTESQAPNSAPAKTQIPPAPQAPASPAEAAGAPATELQTDAAPAKEPRSSDRRKAARLYLEASKLFLDSQFERAQRDFEQATSLDATNKDYRMAAEVARSHAVTALIQAAAKDKLTGNDAAARDALSRALELDPRNIEVSQHIDELSGDVARAQPKELYAQGAGDLAREPELLAAPGRHTFHAHGDTRQITQQVFQAFGVTAMLDDSVRAVLVHVDLDDVTFDEATRVLGMLTHSFYVPLDAHHVLVANDTKENRIKYTRLFMETIYLSGLSDDELKDVETVAKGAFEITQTTTSQAERTITLHAPKSTLDAFNRTMQSLLDGQSQVLLDVKLIQVAHTTDRNTGVQFPQTITAFNVFAEEQSLLNQNQALVQQIISSGLASPNDPLAILGILIASGQVSSSLFSNGFALFGGGLTQSALTTGGTTLNLNLNTSDSRELDDIQLRLENGQKGTLKEGSRYPIQTSSFSSLSPNIGNIPGLTGAGSSSSLGSLLSSLTSTVPNVPMVQYEDLGLTLNATPNVLRNNDVALTVDMKLDALTGTSIDGNPVLDNRAYSSVVTLREGQAAVVATEVDKSQSMSISGTPGISEIPGLNDLTGKDLQQDYATIVIVMTPHVIRGLQAAGHTAMMRIESNGTGQ
jgi:general secretion pathway protein D